MFDLAGRAKMGKDAAVIRDEFRIRLGQIARELGRDPYPDGLPRGTKFSEEFVRLVFRALRLLPPACGAGFGCIPARAVPHRTLHKSRTPTSAAAAHRACR